MTRRIVQTPGTCSGKPRIEGTRITVFSVCMRFMAGEPMAAIAADYSVALEDVETAVRHQAREVYAKWRLAERRVRKQGGRHA